MEKVLYVLWPDPATRGLGERLRDDVGPALLEVGARGVQVNVVDDAVAPASKLRFVNSDPAPEGMVSVWMDSAIDHFRRPFDVAIGAAVSRFAAYLVTESVPVRNMRHPPAPGDRTEGFDQLAFLTRPPRLDPDAWRAIWHDDHTQVAIDTQDTFGYVQNVVVRALTTGAFGYDAVVEELFPAAAMTDRRAFYDAVGDDEKLKRNVEMMMASSNRFLDLDKIDVVPTSQYVLAAVGG